jgi:hypothetical protein
MSRRKRIFSLNQFEKEKQGMAYIKAGLDYLYFGATASMRRVNVRKGMARLAREIEDPRRNSDLIDLTQEILRQTTPNRMESVTRPRRTDIINAVNAWRSTPMWQENIYYKYFTNHAEPDYQEDPNFRPMISDVREERLQERSARVDRTMQRIKDQYYKKTGRII